MMPITVPSFYLLLPIALQAVIIGVDEFLFHRRRFLPRWERIGHPLDTLTMVACYGWLLLASPGPTAIAVYAGLGFLSSLFVTKDEPVHAKHCCPGEHWLHAVLFLLHPVVIISLGLLWPAPHGLSIPFVHYEGMEATILRGGMLLTAAFAAYQFIYWNFVWSPAAQISR